VRILGVLRRGDFESWADVLAPKRAIILSIMNRQDRPMAGPAPLQVIATVHPTRFTRRD
jgi:hypothetical protein